MNFLTMQQELSDRLKAYDETISADATKLKRWLNMAQQHITGTMNWPFMVAQEIVQTVTDITTGTVDHTNASATITFSSAPTVSVADWFIQFSTSNNWYQVTSHTAAATSATITPVSGETTTVGGTYTLRKLFYATSTPLDSILDIKQLVTPQGLQSLSPLVADLFLPLYWGTGTVSQYILGPYDSTDGLQFSLVYSPESVINLMVRGIKKLSDMSSDSDTSVIPTRWHPGVVDIAAGYGFTGLDDTRAKDSFASGKEKVTDMARVYDPDLGRHRVMRQAGGGYAGPSYRWPSQYGYPEYEG